MNPIYNLINFITWILIGMLGGMTVFLAIELLVRTFFIT